MYTLAKIHQPVSLKPVCPVVCKLQLNKVDFKASPAQRRPWPHPAPAQLSPTHLSTPLVTFIILWLLLVSMLDCDPGRAEAPMSSGPYLA